MKIAILLLSFVLTLFAQSTTTESLLQNVLVKNVKIALNEIGSFEKNTKNTSFNLKKSKDDFSKLVYAWKKVQATYIGGDLDDGMLDTPRLIDIYHEGNENIHEQLKRVQSSKDSLDIELFKNSHKSINALEFILYSKEKLTTRDIQILQRISSNIQEKLTSILATYKKGAKKLLQDEKFANSAILNALVANSYKTYEWRVAEGLGKSKKYDKKDATHFEYSFSKQSVVALKAIVDAHTEVMDGAYEDFGDMAIKNGAKKEVDTLRVLLKETKGILDTMKEQDLLSQKGEQVYKNLKEIYINYGLYLVTALEVTAKIVEADGD